MTDDTEIRLRCIEAAVKVAAAGYQTPTADSAMAAAERFYAFVTAWQGWPTAESKARAILGLPKK